MGRRRRFFLLALENVPVLLCALVFLGFGLVSPKFLETRNLVNVLIQASSAAIVATGMTFVLLTGGIDLSVGSIMYLSAAVGGKMLLSGQPLWLALAVMTAIGLLYGLLNGLFTARLRILPFIVTLATLYMGRGLGLLLTETRAMNLPESFLRLGSGRVLGIPVPVAIFAVVVTAAHLVLSRTVFGRHVYAAGRDPAAAHKAGIRAGRLLVTIYVISGACAAIGGIVSVAQLGAVSVTFGNQREFAAVAAAVLGGTSLFGGRGQVLPGTVLGAVLIQMVESGLVVANADPYTYPLVTAGIIFLAVLVDTLRAAQMRKAARRPIRAD